VQRRPRITRARLRDLLHYDSETGEFRWRKRLSRSTHAGDAAGTPEGSGYRKITIEGRQYAAHQLAWLYMTGKWCSVIIDHRDGDRSNNRWANLRRATQSQNCANRSRHRNNRSGFKGVTRTDSGRWRAGIQKNGRGYNLGLFATPQEAHAAYAAAARKLFGEFARAE
jgi:HNH endonuclease/AP2 domain